MKIKILGFLLITTLTIAFCGNVTGQEIKMDWGKSFESKNEISKIIGVQDNIMYAIASKKKDDFLVGYDENTLTEKFSRQIQLPKNTTMLDIVLTKGGPTLIYFSHSNKNKDLNVTAKILGKLGNKNTVKSLMKVSDDAKVRGNVLDIKESADKKNYLVYYTRSLVLSGRKRKVITEFVTFDYALKSINQFEHNNSGNIDENGFVSNADIKIDKNKNILYVLPVFSGDQGKYELFIKQYDMRGKSLNENFIDTKGTYVGQPKIFLDNKTGEFRVVGLSVGMDENRLGYTGVYSAVIEGNTLKEKSSFNTIFPIDFLKKFLRGKSVDRKAQKGKSIYVPGTYSINNVFVTEDGSIVFTAEDYYNFMVESSQFSSTEQWIFGNVICGKLNSGGELKWINIAKKTQIASKTRPKVTLVTGGGGGLSVGASFTIGSKLPAECSNYSYLAGIANNTLVLIYNDHIKLSDRDAETGKSKALRDPKKSLVYKYTFDLETGESKRTALIKESNQGGTYLAPKVFFRNDDNSIIVWGRYKKTQKFGHLIFSN